MPPDCIALTGYLPNGISSRRFRPAFSSEAAIAAIPLRPDSPQWLADEVAETRAGLMKLRQNVVLVPDPEDPDAFHPRCVGEAGALVHVQPRRAARAYV